MLSKIIEFVAAALFMAVLVFGEAIANFLLGLIF